MTGLRKQLKNELERLKEISRKTERSLKEAPKGALRLSKSQGSTQYYYLTKGAPRNGKYISKKDSDLVRRLAQKKYDEEILKYANNAVHKIAGLIDIYSDDRIEEIFYSEHPERQKLIAPVESTFEQSLKEWMKVPYTGKTFQENSPVILTNAGVRVRSKSEKIIADYLEYTGIAYKYECPINLRPFGNVYPDFTILSPKNGQEIYWEHEGMMDNPEYARSAIQKIELYEKNGIYPGEKLILTFETSTAIINSELIKSLVKRYLLCED